MRRYRNRGDERVTHTVKCAMLERKMNAKEEKRAEEQ